MIDHTARAIGEMMDDLAITSDPKVSWETLFRQLRLEVAAMLDDGTVPEPREYVQAIGGHLVPAEEPEDPDLFGQMDAMVWAETFMRMFGGRRERIDMDLMLGWFANAIETGRSEASRGEAVRDFGRVEEGDVFPELVNPLVQRPDESEVEFSQRKARWESDQAVRRKADRDVVDVGEKERRAEARRLAVFGRVSKDVPPPIPRNDVSITVDHRPSR